MDVFTPQKTFFKCVCYELLLRLAFARSLELIWYLDYLLLGIMHHCLVLEQCFVWILKFEVFFVAYSYSCFYFIMQVLTFILQLCTCFVEFDTCRLRFCTGSCKHMSKGEDGLSGKANIWPKEKKIVQQKRPQTCLID